MWGLAKMESCTLLPLSQPGAALIIFDWILAIVFEHCKWILLSSCKECCTLFCQVVKLLVDQLDLF